FHVIYWPISVFLLHPFTIFVIFRKSPMSLDCKCGYVVHHIALICFDTYNGALYQMYPLAPLPVVVCTGSLCNGAAEGATLLTGLSFFTVALCFPYLFIMVRMHQKMLLDGSKLKVNKKKQALLFTFLFSFLVPNVFGFHHWIAEPINKQDIIQLPEIAWANTLATNFLVLGEKEGDVGPFIYELILLIVSIAVVFSFYVLITYHAVFIVGPQQKGRSSKLREAQLRFVYSLTIQVRI
ncbi:hypothetical protein PMAYCL1PPCAC_14887, partial [Pristionchus mayeri]